MTHSRVLISAWLALMAGVFFGALALPSSQLQDVHVRGTVDVSLLYYALAAAAMLLTSCDAWEAHDRAVNVNHVRVCWSLAWLSFAIHVALAFHHAHHWSHAHAVRHTQEVSGVGEGIFVSHLFGLLWGLDVVWWWSRPGSYVRRTRWLGWILHGFMAFIIFCGSVVYETGPIRWVASAGLIFLGWLLLRRIASDKRKGRTRRGAPAHHAG